MNIFTRAKKRKELMEALTTLNNQQVYRARLEKEYLGEETENELTEFDPIGTVDWTIEKTKDKIFTLERELNIYHI